MTLTSQAHGNPLKAQQSFSKFQTGPFFIVPENIACTALTLLLKGPIKYVVDQTHKQPTTEVSLMWANNLQRSMRSRIHGENIPAVY